MKAKPEEEVRQRYLRFMREERGYPASMIAVERALSEFSSAEHIPKRRIDILVHALLEGDIRPLLLIECKAIPLKKTMLDQIFGYNHYVRAPFIALVNGRQCIFGVYKASQGDYRLQRGLPSYDELIDRYSTETL